MAEYLQLSASGVHWWASPEFQPRIKDGPFSDLRRVIDDSPTLREFPSKRTVEFRDGDTPYLIKVYKPRSLWRRALRLGRGSPARRELACCRQAQERDVPIAGISGIAEWQGWSAVVSKKLEGWTSLQEIINRRPDEALIERYGRFGRTVHDAGIDQDDFNPTNVLVNGERLLLIDFERVEIVPVIPEARRLRVVAKLLRKQFLGRDLFESFLRGYLNEGEPRMEILQRIEAMAERQFEIDRQKLRRNCLKENRNFGKLKTGSHVGYFRKKCGLTRKRAESLVDRPTGFDYRESKDAFSAWQEALLAGETLPVAVVRDSGGRRGFLVYPL